MLSLRNAGKRFGPRILFTEANWLIRNREKTALVGANGTGKSTLMKVLAGSETLDYGDAERTRGMSIGYLPQEASVFRNLSVEDNVAAVLELTKLSKADQNLLITPHKFNKNEALNQSIISEPLLTSLCLN